MISCFGFEAWKGSHHELNVHLQLKLHLSQAAAGVDLQSQLLPNRYLCLLRVRFSVRAVRANVAVQAILSVHAAVPLPEPDTRLASALLCLEPVDVWPLRPAADSALKGSAPASSSIKLSYSSARIPS
eukprot:TRINITY_DN63532_c0_g1_i1.p2 TRINITY_DN63532_c0_g1~~TRINITY_DN63532_c0_g1_i1.p2  ORF type:complete len:128 (+),score=18.60 TRINITY_DN63532_c0_g1_i1:42-425(+)